MGFNIRFTGRGVPDSGLTRLTAVSPAWPGVSLGRSWLSGAGPGRCGRVLAWLVPVPGSGQGARRASALRRPPGGAGCGGCGGLPRVAGRVLSSGVGLTGSGWSGASRPAAGRGGFDPAQRGAAAPDARLRRSIARRPACAGRERGLVLHGLFTLRMACERRCRA
jgi:hypothetical protein